jgi:PST family polysaccharide transporter
LNLLNKIHFRFYSITKIIFYLKDSTNYFISNISIALFATSNRLFVGFSGNMNYVAYYDLAEKISSLLKIPQSMFTQSVFPVLSQKSNNSFIRNSFAYSIIFNFLLSIGCFFLSEKIIIISGGHAMIPSVAVLNVLLMTIPVIAISNVLGIQLLIPLGFNNVFKKILISVALFHVSTLAIISIISDYNLLEVAWLSLVSEIIISSLLFLFAMKRQLFKI